MAIKTFKPTTPSRRHMTVSAFEGIDKKAKPERALNEVLKKHAGRNSYGRITVRHHGGGNKQKYRIIDFKRDKNGKATVINLQYDPNRSANIALIEYEDGERRYILAPNGLKAGHIIMTGPDADILPGKVLYLGVLGGILCLNEQYLLGFVIAGIVVIGDLVVFGSGLCPAVTGDGHGNRGGVNGGLTGIKAHRLNDEGNAQFLGNELGEGNIKADILFLAGLAGIHKFHRGEIGAERHMQFALSLDFFQRVGIGGGSVVTVIAAIVRGRGVIAAAGRQCQYHH